MTVKKVVELAVPKVVQESWDLYGEIFSLESVRDRSSSLDDWLMESWHWELEGKIGGCIFRLREILPEVKASQSRKEPK
jgi:hypothetical protein